MHNNSKSHRFKLPNDSLETEGPSERRRYTEYLHSAYSPSRKRPPLKKTKLLQSENDQDTSMVSFLKWAFTGKKTPVKRTVSAEVGTPVETVFVDIRNPSELAAFLRTRVTAEQGLTAQELRALHEKLMVVFSEAQSVVLPSVPKITPVRVFANKRVQTPRKSVYTKNTETGLLGCAVDKREGINKLLRDHSVAVAAELRHVLSEELKTATSGLSSALQQNATKLATVMRLDEQILEEVRTKEDLSLDSRKENVADSLSQKHSQVGAQPFASVFEKKPLLVNPFSGKEDSSNKSLSRERNAVLAPGKEKEENRTEHSEPVGLFVDNKKTPFATEKGKERTTSSPELFRSGQTKSAPGVEIKPVVASSLFGNENSAFGAEKEKSSIARLFNTDDASFKVEKEKEKTKSDVVLENKNAQPFPVLEKKKDKSVEAAPFGNDNPKSSFAFGVSPGAKPFAPVSLFGSVPTNPFGNTPNPFSEHFGQKRTGSDENNLFSTGTFNAEKESKGERKRVYRMRRQ